MIIHLKNIIEAKYSHILSPISTKILDTAWAYHVSHEAFLHNIMLHELSHSLGVKYTIHNQGMVKDVMGDMHHILEECKAEVLAMFVAEKLHKKGKSSMPLEAIYATSIANMLRGIRFGTADTHGQSSMLCLNFFIEKGAIVYNPYTKKYSISMYRMTEAVASLSAWVLQLQAEGDYAMAKRWIEVKSKAPLQVQEQIQLLQNAHIPVDITYSQGGMMEGIEL